MTTALIIIGLIVIGTLGFAWLDDDASYLAGGGLLIAAVLIIWALVAWPWSAYQKDVCQQKAEGYGLERSQWTFRHDCRVYLPGGELVPEGRIRITSDGQIIVTDDE